MEKKFKLKEKFRKNVGKIGEKKVEKKLRKNSMLVAIVILPLSQKKCCMHFVRHLTAR